MHTEAVRCRSKATPAGPGRRRLAGRLLSGLAVAFLAVDAAGKLLEVRAVVDGTAALGYPQGIVSSLGAVLLWCVLVYALPRTSALGAVLLTGYLGGAVAAHVRVGSPMISHVLFPTYVAALVWGGLVLRDPRVGRLLPVRREP